MTTESVLADILSSMIRANDAQNAELRDLLLHVVGGGTKHGQGDGGDRVPAMHAARLAEGRARWASRQRAVEDGPGPIYTITPPAPCPHCGIVDPSEL